MSPDTLTTIAVPAGVVVAVLLAAAFAVRGLYAYEVAVLTALALWAYAPWAFSPQRYRRRLAALYHQHRFEHANCHARPGFCRRFLHAIARLRTLRLRTADTTTRTA